MKKIIISSCILLLTSCSVLDDCSVSSADPIPNFDKTFLPYKGNSTYSFKESASNNIITFTCDTSYEYWENQLKHADCGDYNVNVNVKKVILSANFNNNKDKITITATITSRKWPSSYTYYKDYNNDRLFDIQIIYSNPDLNSYYSYPCCIRKSSSQLAFSVNSARLANYYQTLKINDKTFNNVNEITSIDSNDTIYLNNICGIIKFKINEINYNLIYNQ